MCWDSSRKDNSLLWYKKDTGSCAHESNNHEDSSFALGEFTASVCVQKGHFISNHLRDIFLSTRLKSDFMSARAHGPRASASTQLQARQSLVISVAVFGAGVHLRVSVFLGHDQNIITANGRNEILHPVHFSGNIIKMYIISTYHVCAKNEL